MIELVESAVAFETRAGEFLTAVPERTVLATVTAAAVAGRFADPPPLFALVTDDAGAVTGAALRTPPRGIVCSSLDAGDAYVLLAAWLAVDPEPGSVLAERATAAALGDAWTRLTGRESRRSTAMALHAATAIVDPPRPAPGGLRPARGDGELALALQWWLAFGAEAETGGQAAEAEESVRAAVTEGRLYLWDDGDEPVSMVAHNVVVAGGPRVGPVYTPPRYRGRGFAGSAVAELSRRLLAAGAPRCLLYTDLANPTSNKIYAEVGYRAIADFEDRALL